MQPIEDEPPPPRVELYYGRQSYPRTKIAELSRISGRDTKPEARLRSALHKAGLRFRVCRTDLPGRPDIVFPRQKLAIQVRGCFWHQHKNCAGGRVPGSNVGYWRQKLERNARRDAEKDKALRELGWRVMVIWECEIKSADGIVAVVESALKCRHTEKFWLG